MSVPSMYLRKKSHSNFLRQSLRRYFTNEDDSAGDQPKSTPVFANLRDDNSFKFYRLETPESMSRTKQLIMAVVRKNVVDLQEFLLPEFYGVTDKHGLSLVHIAILQKSKDCFDFLLSLPDFPLEIVSNYGETPLITAILTIDKNITNRGVRQASDYYAWQLLKHGANIFSQDVSHYSTLACCALKHHTEMAEFLIQHGVNINAQDDSGKTALHHALDIPGFDRDDFVCCLLNYGADTFIRNNDGFVPFETCVINGCTSLEEILFDYTFDADGNESYLSVLLQLGRYESPLVDKFDKAVVDDGSKWDEIELFYLSVENLKKFIEKFESGIREILPRCSLLEWGPNAVTLEKVQVLVEGNLKSSMISCIQNLEDDVLLDSLIDCALGEETITKIFLYLLGYGLSLGENTMQRVFKQFGFCTLFKMLLHMDIEMGGEDQKEVYPFLLYDIKTDLALIMDNFDDFSVRKLDCLLKYFSDWKLKRKCSEIYGREIIRDLPQVPHLLELSRDIFRKYFIQRFGIKSCKEFYTLMNDLEVGNIYKKIVRFERAIY